MGIEVQKLGSQKCDINNSIIKNNTNLKDVPGHLAVQVNNCKLSPKEYRLYGVQEKDGLISGAGVEAVDDFIDHNDNFFVLFNIEELRANNQLSNKTKEIVIRTKNHELGRDTINDISGIYLG